MLSTIWHAGATLAAPGLNVMLRRRVARGKEIAERLPERRGVSPGDRPAGRLIWVHAASVGETMSVLPVLEHLRSVSVLVTSGTVTSARLVADRAPWVVHRFVPLDVPAWIARFLEHWRPDAAAFVESELWPNTIFACQQRRIPLVLVNARLSERSVRGWARAPAFAARVLGAFDRVHAQSPTDAERFEALGARDVQADGDLKFAAPPLPADPDELGRLRGLIGERPVWLAAVTHDGEDAIVREAAEQLRIAHPDLLTIVAPRHPDRGAAASAALGGAPRRSLGQPPGTSWVADTTGEMGLLYRLAPIVLMGKSLRSPGGGQNPLEAARLGAVLAAGPHTQNVAAATDALVRAGALTRVTDSASLAAWAGVMLSQSGVRVRASRSAIAASTADQDLPGRIATELLALARR